MSVLIDEYVIWLQIAMYVVQLVHRVQSEQYLRNVEPGLLLR
jgi:hypothetical protein